MTEALEPVDHVALVNRVAEEAEPRLVEAGGWGYLGRLEQDVVATPCCLEGLVVVIASLKEAPECVAGDAGVILVDAVCKVPPAEPLGRDAAADLVSQNAIGEPGFAVLDETSHRFAGVACPAL